MRPNKKTTSDAGSNYSPWYWVKITGTASIAGVISWGGIALITSAIKKTTPNPPTIIVSASHANNQSTDLNNKNSVKSDDDKLIHSQSPPIANPYKKTEKTFILQPHSTLPSILKTDKQQRKGGNGIYVGKDNYNIIIKNLRTHHNGNNGISIEQGADVKIINAETYSNKKNGISVEKPDENR